MSKPLVLLTVLLLWSIVLLTMNGAFGQAISGEIFGTVTDSTGAVVPGAKVTVTNTSTIDLGKYSFTALLPGRTPVRGKSGSSFSGSSASDAGEMLY
jgi:hypothetical protein